MLTCESRASNTSVGIGSGQNSSGTKFSRIFLIIDAPNIGQTFTNKDHFTMIEKTFTEFKNWMKKNTSSFADLFPDGCT
jgi:hypothetical protein